jgi:hypothetical protein
MDALVGHTGFVGSNIARQHNFDGLYNSQSITKAFGTRPNLLIYSGVSAEMFLARSNPAADSANIKQAAENIRRIAPQRLVLISTIAVLDNPVGTDETYVVDVDKLSAYGLHRYMLEQMAREIVSDCHIVRLPALFGKNLKKNFIYDLIHFFPPMLNRARFEEFSAIEPAIARSYAIQKNGFYKLHTPSNDLREAFERLHFSALSFTDSRSTFQFYNLAYLWEHIVRMVANGIPLLHLAVEPITAQEIYWETTGKEFENAFEQEPFNYDYRTMYFDLFGGNNGYIFNREQVFADLKHFVTEAKK